MTAVPVADGVATLPEHWVIASLWFVASLAEMGFFHIGVQPETHVWMYPIVPGYDLLYPMDLKPDKSRMLLDRRKIGTTEAIAEWEKLLEGLQIQPQGDAPAKRIILDPGRRLDVFLLDEEAYCRVRQMVEAEIERLKSTMAANPEPAPGSRPAPCSRQLRPDENWEPPY